MHNTKRTTAAAKGSFYNYDGNISQHLASVYYVPDKPGDVIMIMIYGCYILILFFVTKLDSYRVEELVTPNLI